MADFIHHLRSQLNLRIGLKESVLSSTALETAVSRRMKALNINRYELYHNKLQDEEGEWQELYELLVNTETWFLRDPIAFDFLANELMKHRQKNDPPLSILVAPCSTGEEAFSILLNLLEMGYKLDQVMIEAYDISKRAIEEAKQGVFDRYSFRGKNVMYKDKYFKCINSCNSTEISQIEKCDERSLEKKICQENKLVENDLSSFFDYAGKKYMISENIKTAVQFFNANLLDSSFQTKLGCYDVIFCRNLLVYLDEVNQRKLLHCLSQLMHSKSVLFVSPSEIEIVRKYGLRGISYKRKMVYFELQNNVSEHFIPDAPTSHIPSSRKYACNKNSKKSPHLLDHVESLANEGSYKEAIEKCESYLLECPDSEKAHFLLGVLKQAIGDEYEAEAQFKKAVYLNPKYHQALVYLSLHEEKKGEHQKAELLKKRADRCVE